MTLPLVAAYPVVPITTFRGEEGFVNFYLESDFPNGTIERKDRVPVGSYLFTLGMSYAQSQVEQPPLQGYGMRTRGIRAPESTGATLTVSGLLTQEPDVEWLRAGHPALRAYVDFVDASLPAPRQGDQVNSAKQHVQTILVTDLTCVAKRVMSSDDQIITYSVEFVGGEAYTLPNDRMDYTV